MQSQQKKVKWSRGETASALEERTDTGITEVSVALMENCTADIYGNISRRPALKLIPVADQNISMLGFGIYMKNPTVFPFYISEDDFILLFIQSEMPIYSVRVKNGIITFESSSSFVINTFTDEDNISFAQQNNYAIIACDKWIKKITIELQSTIFHPDAYGVTSEPFVFSGGWYAPNGTQSKAVNIPNAIWNKDELGFTNYTYTDKNGESTVWSYIDSGLTTPLEAKAIQDNIPAGSIIQFPENGAYLRFEGISATAENGTFSWFLRDIEFTSGLQWGASVPLVGDYIKARVISEAPFQVVATTYHNGTKSGEYYFNTANFMVATNTSFIAPPILTIDWVEVTNAKIGIYGPLLTPAAKSDATDTVINVEYGYVSLTPENNEQLPAPSLVCFSEQRLWTAGWNITSENDQYALTIGSQIAKYNDFKNDYNLANEAITLDILTKYKEDVVHLVDYNGLKIFTTGTEWAYTDGRPVKQSTNGALKNCAPIVFGSICLYADQTGAQIRAMQYELQNNIFDSTIINQMTPSDLIWQPIAMAQYEDKINNTGRHLFIINSDETNVPRIATSNFVPGNQANIWSRWTTQNIPETYFGAKPLIAGIINTKKYPIFIVNVCSNQGQQPNYPHLRFAVLDFDAEADLMGSLDNGKYALAANWYEATLPNVTVAVYSNGVYQYETTTDNTGTLVRQPTGLSNVTVGMPINARVVSHPIDVGGKTKTITKRIAKAVMSVRNTEPGAVTINSKTGYMNPAQDTINFYGVTGMKREIIYTITNNKGAKFTIESLTMNIEYGTLIS